MADPDHDIVGVLDTLLSDAANWDNTQPGVVRPVREETSVDPGTEEYVLIAETTEHFENWRGPRTTLDHGGAAFIEAKTITSDARRREIKDDIVGTLRDVRDRREADNNGLSIGEWDHVDYEYTFPDEEIFDVFPIEMTVTFRAWSRNPG